MNHLGMVIDVAHFIEPGFWDVIETSKDPIIDSHSNCRAICDHPRNLTDEQIKAIAKGGGVVGLSCNTAMISQETENPTVDDLIKHVDHMAELVGIDHVGLGPDHSDFEIPLNIWTPAPGWLEGIFYGVRGTYYLKDINNITCFPLFTEALIKHGYSDVEIKKVLGENFLRVYRNVMG
jgi:membrane dipeptidase